ncbi:MAG: type II secretion system protein GspJ [Burkholderiaceae bacterium]
MKSTCRSRGFTLLELLVAVALMGVLAVLCWRGLDSVITSRERITAAADEMRALSTAFTQMDQDLRRSWPVRLFHLQTQRPVGFLAGRSDRDPLMMVLLREGSSAQPAQLQRVVYRLNNGVLERGFSQWQSYEPDVEIKLDQLIWQPLINGVSGLSFRASVNRQWLAGESLTDLTQKALPRGNAEGIIELYDGPRGVEVSLVRGGQSLRRVFAIED